MLIGLQTREACELLWWSGSDLQRHANLPAQVVDRILGGDGDAPLSLSDEEAIREAFREHGIVFTAKGGVRLGRADP